MNTLINVIIIGGLFTLAYFTARLLSETFGVPHVDPADDPNCLPNPEAEREFDRIWAESQDWARRLGASQNWSPTQQEWEDFQRSLDDEGLDEEDHR